MAETSQPVQGAILSATHLIANPFAGRGLKALRRAANEQGLALRWHLPESVEQARSMIEELRNEERLLIAGGDGSFHLATQVLADGKTPELCLGLIPTGTGSDFMRSLPGETSLEARLETALRGAPRAYRPGLGIGKQDQKSFINVASLGVSAAVAYAIEGGLKKLGAFGYTVAMIQGIVFYRSTEMSVYVDGELLMQGKGYLTAVGCGRYFGGGKMIAPHADPFSDQLHMIAVRDQGMLTTLSATRKLNTGQHIHLPIVEHGLGSEIRIEGQGLRSEFDGELGPEGELTFRRGPVAFHLAVDEP
jgi:diacylglycerol kinase family enzyme